MSKSSFFYFYLFRRNNHYIPFRFHRIYFEMSIEIKNYFELIELSAMSVATLLAYTKICHLDIYHGETSKLDIILLFIAVPAFFMDFIFSLAPVIYSQLKLKIISSVGIPIVRLIQILIQTPFIIDGSKRCSNTDYLRKKKPGRELVMFLTIANISIWILQTFSVKTIHSGDKRYIIIQSF